jgi:opacity protein-like surface antigen
MVGFGVKAKPEHVFAASPAETTGCSGVTAITQGLIMKKFSLRAASLLVAVASLTFAAGSQAQSSALGRSNPLPAAGSSYLDLNVGKSDYSLGNGIGIFGSDQGDTSYGIRAGRYFSDNWGLELGYTDFGSIARAGGRTRADGINLSLIGKMPLNPSVALLGKIGTTYSRTDVSSDPASGVVAGSANGFGLSYGVGVEYAFTSNWSATLQYESSDMKFAGDRNDRVGVSSLSARYRF